jgi:hypothetical protein
MWDLNPRPLVPEPNLHHGGLIMEIDEWLVGWREIGKYLGKSGKTAQRWARAEMPFFRDPGGRPMAQKSLIDAVYFESE